MNRLSDSGWVPVADRYPADTEFVLLCAQIPGFVPETPSQTLHLGWWDADSKMWIPDAENEIQGEVTHWHPLPALPELERKERWT